VHEVNHDFRGDFSTATVGILFGLVAASAANAERQPTPMFDRAEREGITRELKAIESESHRERIRIREESEACVQRG
jgi:hypothetical protein